VKRRVQETVVRWRGALNDYRYRASTSTRAVLTWSSRHRLAATCLATVVVYIVGFRVHYCVTDGCTHPADWWFHLRAEAQAAWAGSVGTLVAVWWSFSLFWREREDKRQGRRKAAMAIAHDFITKLQGLRGDFEKLRLEYPDQAPMVVSKAAKRGDLRYALVDVGPSSLTLLQDDELAGLRGLNKELARLNEAARRSGGDLAPDGPNVKDLLLLAKIVETRIGGVLGLLTSRYYIGDDHQRVLSAEGDEN
jgi:hypothetical protein